MPIEAFFLRIIGPDGAGGLTCEGRDGSKFPVPDYVDEPFSPGDVVRVSGEDWVVVDPNNWVENRTVGVVRAMTSTAIVVDTGTAQVAATNSRGASLSVGNTVVLDARADVVEVASPTPLERLPIHIDRSDDEFDPDSFLQPPRAERLRWSDFGGFPDIVEQAKEIVQVHLKRRKTYASLGVTPLRGVIFEGPPGTGKTYLARIMAAKADAALFVVSASELGGRLVGESEGRLQALYDRAASHPIAIVFIDELDGITHHRGAENAGHADRLVSTFLVNMDGFRAKNNILTIGTTNRIGDIDHALRRPGRFGSEVTFRRPDRSDRLAVLQASSRSRKTTGPLSHELLADVTDGWSAAELEDIWTAAATLTVKARRTRIGDDFYVMGYERVKQRRSEKRGMS
ncbi:ATP-binding protein [Nocardioides renjunii]|uniref:ATP-binding protein n=1 Tax=Nocardioides renjunii TaxID=3095075 RepID=UPI002AFE5214|nr:AAA family ATPase [Nocardioides sp. S-34]WQQ21988.1 AAA family ATPase [Nocardioides sp. S-34]